MVPKNIRQLVFDFILEKFLAVVIALIDLFSRFNVPESENGDVFAKVSRGRFDVSPSPIPMVAHVEDGKHHGIPRPPHHQMIGLL
mmetsp:Transcript_46945/g.91644  ORF Transcript_46945/g.91644 Transcript_46945/m.91644 type:complete len:85 (-) Transcript_46945:328-582(-)